MFGAVCLAFFLTVCARQVVPVLNAFVILVIVAAICESPVTSEPPPPSAAWPPVCPATNGDLLPETSFR
jgi:hypothetical protein